MELWDLYDGDKNPTGKTVYRHETRQKMTDLDYHLVVCIIPIRQDGQVLIQKRSPQKSGWPNLWADTGGGVMAGESSLAAAVRELHEEIGILVEPEALHLLVSQKERGKVNYFRDVYVLHEPIDLKDCVLDEAEVSELAWASTEEIRKMIAQGTFADLMANYIDILEAYIQNNG